MPKTATQTTTRTSPHQTRSKTAAGLADYESASDSEDEWFWSDADELERPAAAKGPEEDRPPERPARAQYAR
jgi:hypothetical protein